MATKNSHKIFVTTGSSNHTSKTEPITIYIQQTLKLQSVYLKLKNFIVLSGNVHVVQVTYQMF